MLPRSAGSAKRGHKNRRRGRSCAGRDPTRSRSPGQIPAPATSRIADDITASDVFIDRTASAKPAIGSANSNQNQKSEAAAGRVCCEKSASDESRDTPFRPLTNSPSSILR